MLKKKLGIFIILMLICVIFIGCNSHTISEEYQLIRIHIRANSNDTADQEVKLKVRDEIASYLENQLQSVTTVEEAKTELIKLLKTIESKANSVLKKNGFSYTSKAKLNNEFFPTRSYENIVVESGYYDALIIELGSGEGDNWWCVIYPPLCYLEGENSGDSVRYKSYLSEKFKEFFG